MVRDLWFIPENAHLAYFDDDFWSALKLAGQSAEVRSQVVMKAVSSSRLVSQDALQIRLVTELRRTGVLEAADQTFLTDLHDRLVSEVQRAAAVDHFAAVLLRRNRIFMDRTDLRPRLRRFAEDDDRVALLVGGEACGKSYTYELIRNVAYARGIEVPRVRLSEVASAEEAIRSLAVEINAAAQPPEAPDSDKRLRLGCRWLVQLAKESERRWWFIIDEYNHVGGQAEFRELVIRLATHLWIREDPVNLVRLVVLGFDETLPVELRGTWEYDRTREITLSDVRSALRSALTTAPVDDDTVTRLAEDAWNHAVDNGRTDCALLTQRLEDTISAALG
jgi:hypothetical protein